MWRDDSTETESYVYDSRGDISSSTNPINQTTSNTYDEFNRVITTNTNSKNKEFKYDNDSNITEVSINYQRTAYSYNDFAELLTVNSVDTGLTKFEYDLTARETKKTDADGTQHIYKKDALGRVTQISHTNPQAIETFTYDTNGIGQLANVTDSSGTTSFNYDNLNRITKKTQKVNNITKAINYAYNNLGQLASITYPSGTIINYLYTSGKLSAINVNGNPLVLDISYFPLTDNPISWHLGINGIGRYIIKTYDLNGKLIKFENQGLLDKTISMNGIYNITQITDPNNYVGNNISATYNDNNQIIGVDMNGQNLTYEFDNNMNLKKKPLYSFNYEGNKIYNLIKDAGGFGYFFHDGRGNIKRNDLGDFTYDAKNNLISSNTGMYSTYKFNAFNQRVAKTVETDTTYFMYDGDKLIGEYDNAGNVILEHIYFNNIPVAVLKNNQLYNVHTDEIGTPRIITDSGRNKIWTWDNADIYGGNEANSNYNFTYNLRFAGQYFDFENGLHYNMNRIYDPKTGRYMQSDPIGLNGGDHTYNYVNGNPLSMTDPDGTLKFTSEYDFPKSNKSCIYCAAGRVGYLETDKGRKIKAILNLSPELNNSERNYDADCHGLTFADGKYWIDNDQVEKILEDEYNLILGDEVKAGDIAIFKEFANQGKPDVIHSITLVHTKHNGEIGIFGKGKGGVQPYPQGYIDYVSNHWSQEKNKPPYTVFYYRKK